MARNSSDNVVKPDILGVLTDTRAVDGAAEASDWGLGTFVDEEFYSPDWPHCFASLCSSLGLGSGSVTAKDAVELVGGWVPACLCEGGGLAAGTVPDRWPLRFSIDWFFTGLVRVGVDFRRPCCGCFRVGGLQWQVFLG